MTGTYEVGRDHLGRIHEIDLLLQFGVKRHITQVIVHFLNINFGLEIQVQDGHGHVRRGNANGVTAELAFQFRQSLGNGLGGTGLGDNHVQRGTTTTTTALVVVIDQVLVVGVRVNGFNVTVLNAVFVIDRLQHRGDGVGGAGRGRQDLVFVGDPVIVDSINNVLDIAFARRCQDHPADTFGLQVQAQASFVTPDTGVIHHNGVVDSVLCVIHLVRTVRINHLNEVTIGNQCAVFLIDRDTAIKRTVYGVTTQKARPLFQIIFRAALANNDSAQAQIITATGLFHQNTGQQTTDPTKTVQNNVFGFVAGITLRLARILTNYRSDFTLEEFAQVAAFRLEFNRQLANIDVGTTQFHFVHCLQDGQGVVNRQLAILNLTNKTVGANNINDRLINDRPAVNRRNNVVLAVQTANQRDHGFRSGLSIHPVGQVLVDLFVTHGWNLV